MRLKTALAACTAAAALLSPEAAWACATCFGDPGSPATKGLNWAILTLVLSVAIVYLGIGRVIWTIHKRSRRLPELRLIRGGKH
jgi:hypothetical protein